MPVTSGDPLPEARLLTPGPDGPEEVTTGDLFGTGRSVLFAMPGAFTSTCSGVHVPSILDSLEEIRARGAETVAILTTNDPFVVAVWGEGNGAKAAGIKLLADPEAAFTDAMGLGFSFAPIGLINRSQRYVAVIEDGTIAALQVEESRGGCDLTGGPAALALL